MEHRETPPSITVGSRASWCEILSAAWMLTQRLPSIRIRSAGKLTAAAGKGATMGVLFKNAEAIEFMRKVDTLVVDKTGTLTEGKPELVAVKPAPGFDETRLLQLAASLERASEHPLPLPL